MTNNHSERALRGQISKVFKDLKKANKKKEDDTWFEDDPKAVNEIEYGRVYHEPTIQPFTGGYNPLADVMDKGGDAYVRYIAKHGSARDGVRYTHKKGKK
tara:strand:+ start:200 stop:499 length:300 start_codon:yes stop_codon:yes gene_type:complete